LDGNSRRQPWRGQQTRNWTATPGDNPGAGDKPATGRQLQATTLARATNPQLDSNSRQQPWRGQQTRNWTATPGNNPGAGSKPAVLESKPKNPGKKPGIQTEDKFGK
jgi:hypothetical protein